VKFKSDKFFKNNKRESSINIVNQACALRKDGFENAKSLV